MNADDFLTMSRAELEHALENGHPIDDRDLDNSEFQGVSLGLPELVERLTWKKFMKTFYRDPVTGHLRGWNVRLQQNALDEPCVPKRGRDGALVTFGHYRVCAGRGYAMPLAAGHSLVIDYSLGENPRFDPVGYARDPLVAITAGSVELLLGWSYLDLGYVRMKTPSFFTLKRVGKLSRVVPPPRASRRS